MEYQGVIIEESLSDKGALTGIYITSTKVETVTPRHKTPWLKQWTLHTVTIPGAEADEIADQLSRSLADDYWYADFKNDTVHYIVFPNKVFRIDRHSINEYQAATDYGLTLGIPDYQLGFTKLVA
jgi:hypothetical protein